MDRKALIPPRDVVVVGGALELTARLRKCTSCSTCIASRLLVVVKRFMTCFGCAIPRAMVDGGRTTVRYRIGIIHLWMDLERRQSVRAVCRDEHAANSNMVFTTSMGSRLSSFNLRYR